MCDTAPEHNYVMAVVVHDHDHRFVLQGLILKGQHDLTVIYKTDEYGIG